MKGLIWETWFILMAVVFIVVILFYVTTPVVQTLHNISDTTGNFTTTSVNTSFHNAIDYNYNMWNMWPIAVIIVVALVVIWAADKDEERVGGF